MKEECIFTHEFSRGPDGDNPVYLCINKQIEECRKNSIIKYEDYDEKLDKLLDSLSNDEIIPEIKKKMIKNVNIFSNEIVSEDEEQNDPNIKKKIIYEILLYDYDIENYILYLISYKNNDCIVGEINKLHDLLLELIDKLQNLEIHFSDFKFKNLVYNVNAGDLRFIDISNKYTFVIKKKEYSTSKHIYLLVFNTNLFIIFDKDKFKKNLNVKFPELLKILFYDNSIYRYILSNIKQDIIDYLTVLIESRLDKKINYFSTDFEIQISDYIKSNIELKLIQSICDFLKLYIHNNSTTSIIHYLILGLKYLYNSKLLVQYDKLNQILDKFTQDLCERNPVVLIKYITNIYSFISIIIIIIYKIKSLKNISPDKTGETSSGETSSGETSPDKTGETSSGETSSGETGETSSGETSSGETSSGETSPDKIGETDNPSLASSISTHLSNVSYVSDVHMKYKKYKYKYLISKKNN